MKIACTDAASRVLTAPTACRAAPKISIIVKKEGLTGYITLRTAADRRTNEKQDRDDTSR